MTVTDARSGDDLLLQVTPPRVPRHLLSRARLRSDADLCRARSAVLVRAPAGFGKSSLLAQWRLEIVGRGHPVAWLSGEARDDPDRFVRALLMSVRLATGRPTFGQGLARHDGDPADVRIGAWLAEVAQGAVHLVLMVDAADRIPADVQQLLAQVLRRAPPNLQVVIAAQGPLAFPVDDLVDYGRCAVVGPGVLRFRLDETLDLLRTRFGAGVDNDVGARLQDLTDGWPLGLQLVLAARQDDESLASLAASAQAPHGALRRHFAEVLLSTLPADDLAFLIRVACLDQLHPGLCGAVDGLDGAAARLQRLGQETPVLVRSEHSDWSRLHAVAREALRQRFALLPAAVQADVHARAAAWYERQGLLEDAARHALAGGHVQSACDLAERCLYDVVVRDGKLATGLDWYDRLPRADLERRPRLMRAAAWALAGSERHREAAPLVARLLAQPDVDASLRCEAALLQSAAAIHADDPDRFCALHDALATDPPLHRPELRRLHAHHRAWRALLDGQAALARLHSQGDLRADDEAGDADHAGRYLVGLTYLWEGQPLLAEQLLRPALCAAEADLGRRGRLPCQLAALLAAALWELDRPREAAELLANRLDVLDCTAPAEPLVLAYRTLARAALAAGHEHRAIELLETLYAVGLARRMPRLAVASLAEQVRLHARRYRAEICAALCERIDDHTVEAVPTRPRWGAQIGFVAGQARAYAAIAVQDWRTAAERLATADEQARRLRMGRAHIELLGLRAFVLDRCGERSHTLLREAVELAQAFELRRSLADAHPGLDELAASLRGEPPAALRPRPVLVPAEPAASDATHGGGLTGKEREVLCLLSRNLSNKEIGRALQSSETTVKWHVKNLFAKLDAGSRKEVVHRARLLGMLPVPD